MNKKLLSLVIIVLAVGLVTAGTYFFVFPYDPVKPPVADDTGASPEGIWEVVTANNLFAFDFYNEILGHDDDNLFFSPYSISVALAMTYEGARGDTADEMRSVFHFPDDDVLRPNSAAIYNSINRRDKSYTLRTGNALWVQQDYPFLDDYLFRIENYYGGKASNVDFVRETEKSRQLINSFIEKQTNNRIKDLIPEGALSSNTVLVLTNAIYFLGDWMYQFDKDNTRDRDFFISLGESVSVPMMYMSGSNMRDMKPEPARFNYAELDKIQIIELPYKDEELSMIIVLPKQYESHNFMTGEVVKYEYTLDDVDFSLEKFNEYKSQMEKTSLDGIYLPKFEFETDYNLNTVLSDLGMPSAFGFGADFSGMTGKRDLFITSVLHKAFIKVDEKGTEAAAATAVMVGDASMMPQNVFRAHNPFFFVIQDVQTENILFMGRVVDPR